MPGRQGGLFIRSGQPDSEIGGLLKAPVFYAVQLLSARRVPRRPARAIPHRFSRASCAKVGTGFPQKRCDNKDLERAA
jgi:hypothetical protein